MASNIGYLKVDGVLFPTPSANGFNLGKEKVWSTNTGRTAKAKMVGSILAIKDKLEYTYNVLTEDQIHTISNVLDSTRAYHDVEYYDFTRGQKRTIKAYVGDDTYPLYGLNIRGDVLITGFKFSLVEQ